MKPIGIRRWGLIPVDPEPGTGAPVEMRPPMLTAVAVERGSSLVFEYSTSPGTLAIGVEVTALSAGTRGPYLFRLFTGTTVDAYQPLPQATWNRTDESMFTLFHTQATGIGNFLKITLDEAPALIVNRVEFHHP